MTFLNTLNEFVVSLAGSPWVYLITLAVVIIDGFFPPIPSESVVVALGALAISTGAPNLFLLLLVASVGATTGDTIAYLIGRRIGVDRFRWMRHPRVARAIERARSALDRRAAMLLLTARYIPVGRVAVNMTAGATGFPLRRFLPLAMLAGLSWATYSILIGVLAGAWVHDNPLLGAGVAIVLALVIGFVVDAVLTRVTRRRDARRELTLELESSEVREPELAAANRS
ncbi:DedA family protein [Glaciibacter superstes]|uniref:DedA family protein n=1 Tax=Glaciibacter superstes TaxID=501023 RepID=UPI0003B771D8|nr:DedA family protein [Glaciibacter superstes]